MSIEKNTSLEANNSGAHLYSTRDLRSCESNGLFQSNVVLIITTKLRIYLLLLEIFIRW
jgi:hypothetical protein